MEPDCFLFQGYSHQAIRQKWEVLSTPAVFKLHLNCGSAQASKHWLWCCLLSFLLIIPYWATKLSMKASGSIERRLHLNCRKLNFWSSSLGRLSWLRSSLKLCCIWIAESGCVRKVSQLQQKWHFSALELQTPHESYLRYPSFPTSETRKVWGEFNLSPLRDCYWAQEKRWEVKLSPVTVPQEATRWYFFSFPKWYYWSYIMDIIKPLHWNCRSLCCS